MMEIKKGFWTLLYFFSSWILEQNFLQNINFIIIFESFRDYQNKKNYIWIVMDFAIIKNDNKSNF